MPPLPSPVKLGCRADRSVVVVISEEHRWCSCRDMDGFAPSSSSRSTSTVYDVRQELLSAGQSLYRRVVSETSVVGRQAHFSLIFDDDDDGDEEGDDCPSSSCPLRLSKTRRGYIPSEQYTFPPCSLLQLILQGTFFRSSSSSCSINCSALISAVNSLGVGDPAES